MQRLLIADTAEEFANGIERQLRKAYYIKLCHDGDKLQDLIHSFEPDILLLDMMLPGVDCMSLLRTLRMTGRDIAVVAVLRIAGDYILSQLEALGVKYVLTKPCAVSLAISHIRQISFQQQHPDMKEWCLENELENILLSLGFRMGKPRYRIVCQAIHYKYTHLESPVMKEIYPAVAKLRGSSSTQIEKAIRDAIADAYENGDHRMWRMYFTPRKSSKTPYPTNEEFIARIAGCLLQKTRLKKPYIPIYEKAK